MDLVDTMAAATPSTSFARRVIERISQEERVEGELKDLCTVLYDEDTQHPPRALKIE